MPPHHDNSADTVLVADRSPFARTVLSTIVTMAGYRVVASTGDGTEALALYRAHFPAVTLVTQGLTTRQGEDVAAAIMTHYPAARLIICGEPPAAKPGGRTAAGMIVKPYDQDQVRELLHLIVSPAGQEDEDCL